MIKRFYVLAWFLLAGSFLATIFNGSITDLGLLGFSLGALALVYGVALWTVLTRGALRLE
jgi:hypothetical protein